MTHPLVRDVGEGRVRARRAARNTFPVRRRIAARRQQRLVRLHVMRAALAMRRADPPKLASFRDCLGAPGAAAPPPNPTPAPARRNRTVRR